MLKSLVKLSAYGLTKGRGVKRGGQVWQEVWLLWGAEFHIKQEFCIFPSHRHGDTVRRRNKALFQLRTAGLMGTEQAGGGCREPKSTTLLGWKPRGLLAYILQCSKVKTFQGLRMACSVYKSFKRIRTKVQPAFLHGLLLLKQAERVWGSPSSLSFWFTSWVWTLDSALPSLLEFVI